MDEFQSFIKNLLTKYKSVERIREAGFRLGNQVWATGAVHFISQVPEKYQDDPKLESGFITTTGRFVTRQEAAQIVNAAAQKPIYSSHRQAVGEDFEYDSRTGRYTNAHECFDPNNC